MNICAAFRSLGTNNWSPAGFSRRAETGRRVAGNSTVPGGLIGSGVHWVASTTKGFMLPLTGQQIEIHMESTADKAVERTFS